MNHVVESNSGKALLVVAGVAILDQIFTGGQIRKSITRCCNLKSEVEI